MQHRTPEIENIKELLQHMHLDVYQKHEDFHILKFEKHLHQIPKKLSFTSKGFFEITFSKSKRTHIDIDRKKIELDKEHLLFLSPGQTMNVDSTEETEVDDTFIIFFTSKFLDFSPSEYHIIKRFPFFNMTIFSVYYTRKEVSEMYLDYMERIYNEFQNINADSIEIIKSLLTMVLFETKRKLNEHLNIIPLNNSRKAEITYKFENLIKHSEQKNQKISFYAKQLHISPVYLSECIKATTGKTAKSILTDYILLEAKTYLKNTTKTIDTIAFELGFNDTSNFINYYKKNTSLTPNQERKKI